MKKAGLVSIVFEFGKFRGPQEFRDLVLKNARLAYEYDAGRINFLDEPPYQLWYREVLETNYLAIEPMAIMEEEFMDIVIYLLYISGTSGVTLPVDGDVSDPLVDALLYWNPITKRMGMVVLGLTTYVRGRKVGYSFLSIDEDNIDEKLAKLLQRLDRKIFSLGKALKTKGFFYLMEPIDLTAYP